MLEAPLPKMKMNVRLFILHNRSDGCRNLFHLVRRNSSPFCLRLQPVSIPSPGTFRASNFIVQLTGNVDTQDRENLSSSSRDLWCCNSLSNQEANCLAQLRNTG